MKKQKERMKNKKQKMSNIGQKWAFVVGAFLEDYSARLSASEISKITKIERKNVSRIMNRLVKLNLVNYEIQGRNKLFYFDLKNPKSRILIEMAENQKSLEFSLINEEVFLVVKNLLEICNSVIVFGSFASGKQTKKSDLDLVIFGCNDKNRLRDIKDKYMFEINEYSFSYNEFSKMLKNKISLAHEIMSYHILFGDVSKFVNVFMEVKNG